MPDKRRRRREEPKSSVVLWIVLGCVGAAALVGIVVGILFLPKGAGGPSIPGLPGSTRAVLDPSSAENTSAWAAEAVARIKAAEATGGAAAADAEIARVEKQVKDALVGKQVRWTFPVEAVDEGFVKLETFFGKPVGSYRSEDRSMNGKPLRRLHFRVYFDDEGVKVGEEASEAEASRLKPGSKWTVVRTVTSVDVRKYDKWFMQSFYTKVVDDLEPFCIDIHVGRK